VWGVVWEVQAVGGLLEVGGEDGEEGWWGGGGGGMGWEGKGRDGKGWDGKGRCRERLARPGGSLISRFLPQSPLQLFVFALLSYKPCGEYYSTTCVRGALPRAFLLQVARG